ncbi:MAG: T9SS type A sorting domain-containing protein [Ignavibacteria bacterium]|nr:T9SS type A sorting domain-containing protein [Ignavibacteria bacterium]MCU7521082.1 T9SS type A sorting domain-containing protein [Ignavibacteria bacterium]
MKPFKFLVFVSLCFIFFSSGKIFSQVTRQDSLALIDFFNSTKGSSWTNHTNWLSSMPVGQWYGVTVKNNRVEKISFELANNLQDSIPPSFGSLTELKELNLNYNSLTSIPHEIGSLKALEKFSIRSNLLKSVPAEISELRALKDLELSDNYLSALPDSLGKLENLEVLKAENNQISEVPSSLESLKHLRSLIISGNLLPDIPLFLSHMSSLRVLNVGVNPVPEIPLEIAHMDSLIEFYADGCQITSIPPEITGMRLLAKLDLRGNLISSVPQAVDSLNNLKELYLDNNRLTKLPLEIGGLKNLKILSLRYNHITELPASIGGLKNLDELELQYNRLSSIPKEMGSMDSLKYLYLNNNLLTDSIPKELGNLKSLVYLSLNQNFLTGSIPASLGKMGKLQYLYLEVNELDSLPDFSGDTSLVTLTAYDNHLTFEDIEPVLKLHNVSFYYGPQDSIGKYTDTIIHTGDVIKLSVKVGGSDNRYQWFKNEIMIPGANSDVFNLNPKDSLASGSYNCMITSGIAKDLAIYSRPVNVVIGEMTAVLKDIEVPKVFELHQNFPNPFNPSTRISYDIPKEGRVVLKIYSMDGREVATIVDEYEQAGRKTAIWNGRDSRGSQVSSGMYFYKLQSGGEIKTRKMMLLK